MTLGQRLLWTDSLMDGGLDRALDGQGYVGTEWYSEITFGQSLIDYNVYNGQSWFG